MSFNFYLLNKLNLTKVEIIWLDKEGRSTREGATSLVLIKDEILYVQSVHKITGALFIVSS